MWHTNRTHFETLYLASDRYCIHMYMYMYNVELFFNCHVTDIMIMIIFLLSLYLWLHCEFRDLVIRIYMYMYIVYTCMYVHCIYMYVCTLYIHVCTYIVYTYIVTYTYLFCTSCPQCVLCQLDIIGRCGLYTSNSPSLSSYLCLHTVFVVITHLVGL